LAVLGLIILIGLGIFAVRFQNYFAAGATSVGARFDYWRAALQTTKNYPLLGTGPGTFQRPYAKIKSPNAEMARLAHNDYLEQFSDSGIPGGIFYAAWIFLSLATIARRVWKSGNQTAFAIFAGMLGWFVQGIGEFSLYVPALAWTAFTLLGCSLALTANQFDKKLPDV
jgi:O-antigen ligase